MGNFRQISRQEWSAADTVESINAGSLQRIADATEAMAKGHVELARERDNYKRWYEQEQERRNRLDRRIIALRGVITRIKRKAVTNG